MRVKELMDFLKEQPEEKDVVILAQNDNLKAWFEIKKMYFSWFGTIIIHCEPKR